MKGIRLQAHPNIKQKKILSQWMGCAQMIKPTAPIDQTFSQYKSKELTSWLKDEESQVRHKKENGSQPWLDCLILKARCFSDKSFTGSLWIDIH